MIILKTGYENMEMFYCPLRHREVRFNFGWKEKDIVVKRLAIFFLFEALLIKTIKEVTCTFISIL